MRNKAVKYCPATVIEDGGEFTRGPWQHIHEPRPRAIEAATMVKKIKV